MSVTSPDCEEIGIRKLDKGGAGYAGLVAASMDKEKVYIESAKSENTAASDTDSKRAISVKVRKLLTIVAIVGFIALITGCFVVLFVKLTSLESKTALLQQQHQMLSSQLMANDSSIMLPQEFNNSFADIEERLAQVSVGQCKQAISEQVQQLNASFSGIYNQLNDRLISLDSNLSIIMGRLPSRPSASCNTLPPSSPSGYYWVRASTGSAVRVYCDMTRSCGNVTGGWMRVAYLDMTDSSQQCPSALRQRMDNTTHTCVTSPSPSCSLVDIQTFGLPCSFLWFTGKQDGSASE